MLFFYHICTRLFPRLNASCNLDSTSFQNNTFLIDQLTKGNEKAYVSILLTHHHKSLYVYALSLTNDHDMSEDIVQNVFIRTWEFRRKLKKNHTIKGFLIQSNLQRICQRLPSKKGRMVNLEKVYVEAMKRCQSMNKTQKFVREKD